MNLTDFDAKLALFNKILLLAVENPTTMPLILKLVAATGLAVSSSGANVGAELEMLQDVAAIQQNLIDAETTAKAAQSATAAP